MKKVISVLIVLVFVLSGCSSIAKDSLGNNNWEFSRIIETENGKVAFSSENNSTKFSDAKIIDLSCTANDNEIILKDNTTNNEWILSYTVNETAETNNADGQIYDISYTAEEKNITGYATTGIANLNDISQCNYLIITLGGYELYFIESEKIILE